ncbi:hypothetical protein SteCoe_2140 [Stentor coeruleus]|uniref:Uncharacterized protein n=1 Tax=Stentor coeruleus TaxID=5963 RepID=A0A1R2D057_9CILI|nr:hypothetical protein SteCoe_2140 [Stentor coeruleus]
MKAIENTLNLEHKALPKVENLDFIHELPMFVQSLQKFIDKEKLPIPRSLLAEKKFNKLTSLETLEENHNSGEDSSTIHQMKKTPDFELQLSTDLITPLCKCKYFSIKVYLKPVTFLVFPTSEKVELQVLICSQDGKVINKNMKGQDILRGNHTQKMNYFLLEKMHVAYFRIQVTEVSSHFIGKTVNLKIKSKSSDFIKSMGWTIRPIVIKNITIKAKEPKTKQ